MPLLIAIRRSTRSEGSGNVAALDVLRAMFKEPEGLPAFLAECELARGGNRLLDAHLDRLRDAGRASGSRARGAPRGGGSGAGSRPACWSATRRRRWRTRSAPDASARAAACSAPCRLPWTRSRSWSEPWRCDRVEMNTIAYEVDGRIARITLDRPERGNGITSRCRASWPTASSGRTSIPPCT